ncbi:MAG: glycoside hydrolase family 43 protein, partial [Candidatus Hydrogenedentes bacterium]|nr:glycoside hydrolase family 43 protein [Candidatus Hydrogenedentota bacterium]
VYAMESADLCAVYCNPIQVPVADPVIYYEAGTYYLYGTWDVDSLTGIAVHTSRDLVHWQWQGFAFRKTETTHGQRNFWGAEVIKHGEEYLLYYCASPNREDTLPLNMAIYVAKGKSPLGPFKEWKAPLYAANESDEAIDQNFFLDEDGTPWLYFVRVTRMHNEIWVAKLSQDLGAFEGEPTLCIRSEAGAWDSRPWEGHRVAEGPLVFKRNGVYCLEYTGNHFLDPDYAIGFATADTPRGPWKRYDGNPVLSRSDKVFGPGNACIVPSPDGTEEFIVYHIHQSPRTPQPRYLAIDRIRIKAEPGGKMSFSVEGPTHTPQVLPAGAAARPYAVSDDFTGASLVRKQWSVLHEDPDNWYYEKGDLVIQTQAGDCW